MPLICTKDQKNCNQPFTTRVLVKNQAKNDINNQTLKTFTVKNVTANAKALRGTAIPNSSIKGKLENVNRPGSFKFKLAENNFSVEKKSLSTTPTAKLPDNESKVTQKKHGKDSRETLSIVSGSEKLRELQELSNHLNKNSNVSKSTFEPRRPTLESIKSAIEKAKELELNRDKNEGTDDRNYITSMCDASTSTKKVIKKKKILRGLTPSSKTPDGNRQHFKRNERNEMNNAQVSAHLIG